MIIISNLINDPSFLEKYQADSFKSLLVGVMNSSNENYHYPSLPYLDFELELRKNIVSAAHRLYRSRLAFKTFHNSICNEEFWERTPEGGFLSRRFVKPSVALEDIYINGRLYGTECATAIVIVFYMAILQVFAEELFNEVFPEIYLMDWQSADTRLGLRIFEHPADYLPGDCRYFKNPDVDPLTPEWQGENVIDLSSGLYYGHGIGITPPEKMIEILNRFRINGSETSAYLMDMVTRPDMWRLADIFLKS